MVALRRECEVKTTARANTIAKVVTGDNVASRARCTSLVTDPHRAHQRPDSNCSQTRRPSTSHRQAPSARTPSRPTGCKTARSCLTSLGTTLCPDGISRAGPNSTLTFTYSSWTSVKKLRIASSVRPSWRSINFAPPAVRNADTFCSLNLSTSRRYLIRASRRSEREGGARGDLPVIRRSGGRRLGRTCRQQCPSRTFDDSRQEN